jgi:hypothetical protein
MNKQSSPDQIRRFRFEANRSKGYDKEFMALVANASLQDIDPTTLHRMRAAIYMGDDLTWVKSKLIEVKNTFTSEVI